MKNAILKNMEALFIAALLIAGTTTFAAAKIPSHKVEVTKVDGNLYTVTVNAKRLSAEAKAAN